MSPSFSLSHQLQPCMYPHYYQVEEDEDFENEPDNSQLQADPASIKQICDTSKDIKLILSAVQSCRKVHSF